MFRASKTTLAVAAVATAAMATTPLAEARINISRNPQVLGAQTELEQVRGAQAPTNEFDWADAGIGAAAGLMLAGAGTVALTGRRRQARHTATG
jgi:hypothetical protein